MFHVSPQSDMWNPTAKIDGPFFGLDKAMGSVRLWCSTVGGTHAWIWGILFFTPFLFICKPILIFRDFFSMATQPITLASHFLYICDCEWISCWMGTLMKNGLHVIILNRTTPICASLKFSEHSSMISDLPIPPYPFLLLPPLSLSPSTILCTLWYDPYLTSGPWNNYIPFSLVSNATPSFPFLFFVITIRDSCLWSHPCLLSSFLLFTFLCYLHSLPVYKPYAMRLATSVCNQPRHKLITIPYSALIRISH